VSAALGDPLQNTVGVPSGMLGGGKGKADQLLDLGAAGSTHSLVLAIGIF